MDSLNFHHLRYFWVVAREGGLVPAAKALRLSHPTLSAQIKLLEAQLEAPLFEKVGRKLELTETGRVVYRYADDIFSLGRDLVLAARGHEVGQALRLAVGIVDAVPKSVVMHLLQPALALDETVRLVCVEGSFERLLGDLALHNLDVVISDAPVPPGSAVRAFHHVLGDSDVELFATRALAQAHAKGYPQSLDGAPMLLPLEGSPLRRALGAWFSRIGVTPRVVGEFEDSALIKAFGAGGAGIFPAPAIVRGSVARQYGVTRLGAVPEVKERFYAITTERRLRHPAVVAITEAARTELFARPRTRTR